MRKNDVNEYSKFFDVNMSSIQARSVLFSLINKDTDSATKNKILNAYRPVSRAITDKEFKHFDKGWTR